MLRSMLQPRLAAFSHVLCNAVPALSCDVPSGVDKLEYAAASGVRSNLEL
jgi:NAD(P)H-hydrate repair Nnr-like enzyme with NAD(P)H-hydrate epimerase domain